MTIVARPDFTTITESTDTSATRDQLSMLQTRYDLGRHYASGKDVLEVACGTGIGLGYLASTARAIVGGDIDLANCRRTKGKYEHRKNIAVINLEGERLPFCERTFDTVILFEALYYIADAKAFLKEAQRVLRPGGTIVLSSVNCTWSGFNPSPFSTRYFSGLEVMEALCEAGFRTRLFAGFPEKKNALCDARAAIRKISIILGLIPKTMKGKQFLKRAFYGKLTQIPSELSDGVGKIERLCEIDGHESLRFYRMLYAVGELLS